MANGFRWFPGRRDLNLSAIAQFGVERGEAPDAVSLRGDLAPAADARLVDGLLPGIACPAAPPTH